MSEAPAEAVIASPLPGGRRIGLVAAGGALSRVKLLPATAPLVAPSDPLLREAAGQVTGYFSDPAWRFDLPMAAGGTVFQRRVWDALCELPPGRPSRYGELAGRLGSSARAVAAACRANPLPLVVPCHRVVSAQGIGGFMGSLTGAPVELKRWLLEHESHAPTP